MYQWTRPISILLIVALGWSFRVYIPNHIPINLCWSSSFSSVFLLPQFFHCMWMAFFLISPSPLSWIIALLLVGKSIIFDCAKVYLSLCTMFSWFCSFHSASIPGGHSSSHGIPPVHYSFEHNSIPSPTDTTTCSAIPHWRIFTHFPFFLPP